MGREIRMVPANWDHPKYTSDDAPYSNRVGSFMPMHDEQFEKKFAEWLADFDRIRAGNLTAFERECFPLGLASWLVEDGLPPDPKYYRPWRDEEATWFQLWETVSEGTPVTPPFATKAELVDYLSTKGDFWDQSRGDGAWTRENAERFVDAGWAPSMMVMKSDAGVEIITARDGGRFKHDIG
jgi:hypothetical protein